MKPRNTLIVVGLFAVLLGYVYFVELNKTPEQLGTPTPKPAQYLFQLSPSEITGIEVSELQSSRVVKLTHTEGGWKVNLPTEKVANQSLVSGTVSDLAALQYTRVLTNVTDLAPFGFVTATLEARVTMSNTQSYAITVGGKTPDGSYYYVVYTGDKSKVFLVDPTLVESLKGWFDNPPYEPTPTPTFTPTPPVTPTLEATPTISPTIAVPGFVPTLVPTVVSTPKP